MKLKFPLIAAFVAILSLTACGGGSGDSGGSAPVNANNPAALVKTDNTLGTGAEAVSGKTANVTYTLWLYSAATADHKGTRLESNTFSFKLGTNAVIPGFEQGVTGMKVGGKRTIEVPSSLGYGSGGTSGVPGNAGLVFEIILNKVE
ncbi:FKBP-type peptidyl-prolyl cis-trans isomerase [Massilia yuzhufengensis]|uniref:Peptidyl-prolyl cis-trans isomerase n=1 Tax=Massilia yuzhufengensis TaxID=1164594 RepID=A0A1I1DM12_9BURK|nr:FKBP-type peptidyl-prolyl cis-trans isomerase [Massilia yuzhufengensis]SFB73553.1 FKBP-type peptidyl-prolyl cis-trans isomerase FkpA [Massilia yuzhufengensis]